MTTKYDNPSALNDNATIIQVDSVLTGPTGKSWRYLQCWNDDYSTGRTARPWPSSRSQRPLPTTHRPHSKNVLPSRPPPSLHVVVDGRRCNGSWPWNVLKRGQASTTARQGASTPLNFVGWPCSHLPMLVKSNHLKTDPSLRLSGQRLELLCK